MSSPLYKEPLTFDSNTVLRVRSFSKNKLPSRPTLNSYFIGIRHDFPCGQSGCQQQRNV